MTVCLGWVAMLQVEHLVRFKRSNSSSDDDRNDKTILCHTI
jgi:hypothetical protein|eukprot:COSAG06_NODE_4006_length_4669_cov_3.911160_2_plen_41_part_00